MNFTMMTDKTVSTKQGHTIQFVKGVPTHVPKECWTDVQQAGAVPEDQEKVHEEQRNPQGQSQQSEVDPTTRKELVFGAFTALTERNKRGDFTGSGFPSIKAIEKITGFEIDVKERDLLWHEFTQRGAAT